MRKPSIHLNGTDAQSLFDGYYAALKAIHAAQEKLAAAAPNGRDYYVQEPYSPGRVSPINEAMDEHRDRMAALESVERDLQQLAMHVMDASDGKAVRT